MKGLFGYELDKYLRSSKIVIPLLIYFAYLAFAYSIAPLRLLNSFGMCALVVFLLMLALGVMYDDINYPMIEQSLYIRSKHKSFCYISKVLVITFMSFMITVISLLFPVIRNLLMQGTLFNRSILPQDILSGFLLFFLISVSGGMIGLLINRRIIPQRELALGISLFLGILTVIRGAVNSEFLLTRYITWVLPPVYDLCQEYCREEFINFTAVSGLFIQMLFYDVIIIFLYSRVMLWKKFE